MNTLLIIASITYGLMHNHTNLLSQNSGGGQYSDPVLRAG